MLDLDHFKDSNDRFGHLFGDPAMANVGIALRCSGISGGPGNLLDRRERRGDPVVSLPGAPVDLFRRPVVILLLYMATPTGRNCQLSVSYVASPSGLKVKLHLTTPRVIC